MKRKATFAAVCVALMVSFAASAVMASEPPITFGHESNTTPYYSPLRGTDEFKKVTSAWNQPRDGGSNPHTGVDLGADQLPVYPLEYGTVAAINYDSTQGWYIYINRSGGYQDRFLHLKANSWGSLKVDDQVSPVTQIAVSGNSPGGTMPYHLDFRIMKNVTFPDGASAQVSVNPYPHYTWSTSSWRNGRDLSFIKKTRCESDRWLYTVVYSTCNVNGRREPLAVDVFIRPSGTTTWDDPRQMVADSQESWGFKFDLWTLPTDRYPSGTYINVLVRARRKDVQPTYNYAWDAPKHYQPMATPNSVSYKYNYYTARVVR